MAKILVTGGAGFIGSNLVDALIKNKHKVVIIDNLSTGSKKNINPKAIFHKADISDFKKIEKIFTNEKPKVVFHLAAQIDVRKSVADPLNDANINILGGLNLVRLSKKYKIKKFIFSSTGGAIYGETKNIPTSENETENPLSPYGVAKLSIDKYLNYFHQIHNLSYTSLRYGNVYGPRQNPHGEAGVVAIFLNKMLLGEQPIINGKGEQTRDYIFVEDIVAANIKALENPEKIGVYNIGTGKETSVNELFGEINKHFQGKFKEKHGSAKKGEQMTSCLDFAKIKNDLGWQPKTNFSEGIEKTFNWFKENAAKRKA